MTKPLLCGALVLWLAASAQAQIVTTLFSFDGADGHGPEYMALVQGTDGNLYGTTEQDGTYGCGVVFTITPEGAQTVLHDFCSQASDGAGPYAGVIQATDGNFYGTTAEGGVYGYGAIFRMTPAGEVTTLYSFCAQGYPCSDGRGLMSPLVQATDGNLYGTTPVGGTHGGGTAFKITLSGTLTTLYNFCAQPSCLDGEDPGGLIQGIDGDLYGFGAGGPNNGSGVIFKLTLTGTETIVESFDGTDGFGPTGLSAGPDGNFYGTTFSGGTYGLGTVFKVTPAGKLTTLHSFCAKRLQNGDCIDGSTPLTAPALGSDGYYFGMTPQHSTIYGVTPTGGFRNLYVWGSFRGGSAGLVQGTDGLFYGTTQSDGAHNQGTVFSLNVGLGPFVKTNLLAGKLGSEIEILGTDLTGATSVTFNGTPATFTVVSPSEITSNVPSGATTGRVKVSTPSGTLISNLPFAIR